MEGNPPKPESIAMIAKFYVVKEIHNRWPATDKFSAGESFNLLLQDMTNPPKYALRTMLEYRLSEEEKEKHWAKIESKTVEIGITEILTGNRKATLRGEIVAVSGDKKS